MSEKLYYSYMYHAQHTISETGMFNRKLYILTEKNKLCSVYILSTSISYQCTLSTGFSYQCTLSTCLSYQCTLSTGLSYQCTLSTGLPVLPSSNERRAGKCIREFAVLFVSIRKVGRLVH